MVIGEATEPTFGRSLWHRGARIVGTWGRRLTDRRLMVPALERGVRAAVVVPVALAIGRATGQPQIELFAAFGAIALLLLVEFNGPPVVRLRAFCALVLGGSVLVVLGTACSQVVGAAVPLTAVVVFAVLFGVVLSPLAAQASTAALLFFILPVAVPVGPGVIGQRLAGVGLAAALAVPAAMALWPTRARSHIRLRLAAVALAVADALEGARDPAEAEERMERRVAELLELFDGNSLPAGLTASDRALCTLVGHLQWTATQVRRRPVHFEGDPRHPGDVRALLAESGALLRAAAAILTALDEGSPVAHGALEALIERVEALEARKDRGIDLATDYYLTAATAPPAPPEGNSGAEDSADLAEHWLHQALDPAFRARALAVAVATVGRDVVEAAGRPPQSFPRREVDMARAARHRLTTYLTWRSAWFRNSVRGAAAISLAVMVVDLTNVERGFWVVLGVLSVLRSSAVSTGATAARAVAGTVIGVVVGSILLWLIGPHLVLLWVLLPLTVAVAAIAPVVGSFTAGQGAFSLVVMILFNVIEPIGLAVGLVRVRDVALGSAVALGVGLLFWPRGAGRLLAANLCRALGAHAGYLQAAVGKVMASGRPVDVAGAGAASAEAARLLRDTLRDYMSDRGAKRVETTALLSAVSGAIQAREAADALARLPNRGPPDALGGHLALRLAGDEIRLACSDVERWCQATVDAVAAGRPPPEGVDHSGLIAALSGALDDVRQSRAVQVVPVVMRLLWACEDLGDLRRLEPVVVGLLPPAHLARRGVGGAAAAPAAA